MAEASSADIDGVVETQGAGEPRNRSARCRGGEQPRLSCGGGFVLLTCGKLFNRTTVIEPHNPKSKDGRKKAAGMPKQKASIYQGPTPLKRRTHTTQGVKQVKASKETIHSKKLATQCHINEMKKETLSSPTSARNKAVPSQALFQGPVGPKS